MLTDTTKFSGIFFLQIIFPGLLQSIKKCCFILIDKQNLILTEISTNRKQSLIIIHKHILNSSVFLMVHIILLPKYCSMKNISVNSLFLTSVHSVEVKFLSSYTCLTATPRFQSSHTSIHWFSVLVTRWPFRVRLWK